MSNDKNSGQSQTTEDRIAALERRIASLERAAAEQWPWFRMMTVPNFVPNAPVIMGCAVCGIGADGRPMGYVCPRNDCPGRIS